MGRQRKAKCSIIPTPYRKRHNLKLSSLAESDIEDIAQYTYIHYGSAQVDKYLDVLMKAMQTIAENPCIGHDREDLPDNYRAFYAEKHIIAYKLKEQIVYVSRILHESMDFRNQTIE
ncbi:MAG: type II toxin-antitoxin system RelE/ParE family toxin [Candidatus Anammoxibacter sp.]